MRCPECGSTRVRADARGEVACEACGLVLSEPTLHAEPLRAFERATGLRLTGRLARAQKRADERSGSERRFVDAAQHTRRVGTEVQCPADVAEEAARLLARAQKAGLTQGRDLRALGAASLLASCRRLHLARREEDVARAADVDLDALRAAFRALVRGLALDVPSMTAIEYVAQLGSRLRVEPAVETRARALLAPICGTRHAAGRDPLGWAAAALALASEGAVSARRAAGAAGVSASTVTLRMRDLRALRSST